MITSVLIVKICRLYINRMISLSFSPPYCIGSFVLLCRACKYRMNLTAILFWRPYDSFVSTSRHRSADQSQSCIHKWTFINRMLFRNCY